MARLGDICTIYTGTGFPVQYQGNSKGKFPFYKVGDIAKNVTAGKVYLELCDNYVETDVVKKIKGSILPARTVVFAKIGEAVKLNRRAITSCECLIDNNAMGIAPNEAVLTLDYFYHYMCQLRLETLAEATTVPSVKKSIVENLDLPVPSIVEQQMISKNLNDVCELIALRKEQLVKLDQLVESRFVELFGSTPDEEKVTMAEICRIITDGTHQPPKFVSAGIPFLFVSNIVTNEICYDAQKFISEETYAELIKRTPIAIGDVLLSTVGSYGHPAVVKTEKPFCFQRHIAYLKPNSDKVDSEYLRGAILSSDVQRQIDEGVKGIAQKTLNLSEIRKIKLPLPPMELQEQFAAFVEQIGKSRLAIQQSLDKLETLKKSLMQEYFG